MVHLKFTVSGWKCVDFRQTGHKFESLQRILDGSLFPLHPLKKRKKPKEAGEGPFFKSAFPPLQYLTDQKFILKNRTARQDDFKIRCKMRFVLEIVQALRSI